MSALAQRLEAIVAAAARQPWQLEASIRRGPDGLRAGRVMLENVAFPVVQEVAAALSISMPARVAELAELARAEGVPLIAGWDTGEPSPRAKLYLNTSDSSVAVRRRLCAAALPSSTVEDPHVIGIDLRSSAAPELKLYRQDSDAARLAETAGAAAARLATDAIAASACAGAVMSWLVDARGVARPRAFFIATRAGAEPAIDRLVERLPAWDRAQAAALLPFDPGAPRSIGIAIDDPESWTVYFKPRGVPPIAQLEAAAQFRAGGAEVGVFIEPAAVVSRAFARTSRHALTYRPREGRPEPHQVEALMTWAVERVAAAERAGTPPEQSLSESAPPSPWQRVAP